MKNKDIAVVTGIRSEYDILYPLLSCIQEHEKLNLRLFVTGAHLSEKFGYTVQDIQNDGFSIEEKIYSLLDTDDLVGRAKGVGVQLQSVAESVNRVNPDMLLVFGDREETITTALSAQYLDVPIAHLSGGDAAINNVDDQIRHAVTKLSHLHFVTNRDSYERVLELGEQPFRVYNVGDPGLDRLAQVPEISSEELSSRLDFDISKDERFILLIQHVLSSEVDQAYQQMKETLEALDKLGIKTVLSYPNSDAGSRELIRAIEEYEAKPYIYASEHIPRTAFVNLMRNADCMLGNSSAGILEAPFLGLPVVNVGRRQEGRLHAENVQFVEHNSDEIVSAVKRALFDEELRKKAKNCKSPYGDGNSSERIVEILSKVDIDRDLLVKDITY